MGTELTGKKKRSFIRGLLWFALGFLALIGTSALVTSWAPDQMVGTNKGLGLVEVTGNPEFAGYCPPN